LWLTTIMRYNIQPAARHAGIQKKIGWHTFRHTFSSLVKSLGVDVKVVQERCDTHPSARPWTATHRRLKLRNVKRRNNLQI
jgi:integrase